MGHRRQPFPTGPVCVLVPVFTVARGSGHYRVGHHHLPQQTPGPLGDLSRDLGPHTSKKNSVAVWALPAPNLYLVLSSLSKWEVCVKWPIRLFSLWNLMSVSIFLKQVFSLILSSDIAIRESACVDFLESSDVYGRCTYFNRLHRWLRRHTPELILKGTTLVCRSRAHASTSCLCLAPSFAQRRVLLGCHS